MAKSTTSIGLKENSEIKPRSSEVMPNSYPYLWPRVLDNNTKHGNLWKMEATQSVFFEECNTPLGQSLP